MCWAYQSQRNYCVYQRWPDTSFFPTLGRLLLLVTMVLVALVRWSWVQPWYDLNSCYRVHSDRLRRWHWHLRTVKFLRTYLARRLSPLLEDTCLCRGGQHVLSISFQVAWTRRWLSFVLRVSVHQLSKNSFRESVNAFSLSGQPQAMTSASVLMVGSSMVLYRICAGLQICRGYIVW